MSYIKFSPNLFLERQELNRFKKFLDDDGFRRFILLNSQQFGLINNQFTRYTDFNGAPTSSLQNEFLNGLVSEGGGLSLSFNAITALDSNGNLIISDAGSLPVPNDNKWYWVKIKHAYTSKESGTVSILSDGTLTGTSTKFLDVLRGQPNFPSRIKFVDVSLNTQEYDVLEVIDNTNAILDGSNFSDEFDLQYIVVGTFTPASSPSSDDKEIFQYDGCEISLEEETSLNTRPTYIEGREFFLARVKRSGSSIKIQDKRKENVWLTKAEYNAFTIDRKDAVLFGVEKITYAFETSTLDFNFVTLAWAFRSSNYTIDTKLNLITINAGNGGKYKDTSYFSDGEFDGWRLYTSDGKYSIIKSSSKTASQINLYLDSLDVDSYSGNGGNTFHGAEILITPDADEIEIIAEAVDQSGFNNYEEITNKSVLYPINSPIAKLELHAYRQGAVSSMYAIFMRLKKNGIFSHKEMMPSDVTYGYYSEDAFDAEGDLLYDVSVDTYSNNVANGYIKTYASNVIRLRRHVNAYGNEWSTIPLFFGDVRTTQSGNSFYFDTSNPSTDERYIKYKVLGKTCFVDFNIENANTSNSPVPGFVIKLPDGIRARSIFHGTGYFRNKAATSDNQSSNTSPSGTTIVCAARLRTGTVEYFVQQGDSIYFTPARDFVDNFETAGSNNLTLQGQIFFEIY